MKDYCFSCNEEEFIPIFIKDENGEEIEVGRECVNCGTQELFDDYQFYDDENVKGNIRKIKEL